MARKKVKKQTKKRSLRSSFLRRVKLPAFITIIGILLMAAGIGIKIHNATKLSFFNTIPSASITRGTTQPIRITIQNLQIDLPLSETRIQNNVWEISQTGASHLTTSAEPGSHGNIIIYAHNTNDRFGKITQIKPGDKVFITALDGKVHVYKVVKTETVNPDQIELLLPTATETLTMYTCTGFLDSKRFVVVAKTI